MSPLWAARQGACLLRGVTAFGQPQISELNLALLGSPGSLGAARSTSQFLHLALSLGLTWSIQHHGPRAVMAAVCACAIAASMCFCGAMGPMPSYGLFCVGVFLNAAAGHAEAVSKTVCVAMCDKDLLPKEIGRSAALAALSGIGGSAALVVLTRLQLSRYVFIVAFFLNIGALARCHGVKLPEDWKSRTEGGTGSDSQKSRNSDRQVYISLVVCGTLALPFIAFLTSLDFYLMKKFELKAGSVALCFVVLCLVYAVGQMRIFPIAHRRFGARRALLGAGSIAACGLAVVDSMDPALLGPRALPAWLFMMSSIATVLAVVVSCMDLLMVEVTAPNVARGNVLVANVRRVSAMLAPGIVGFCMDASLPPFRMFALSSAAAVLFGASALPRSEIEDEKAE